LQKPHSSATTQRFQQVFEQGQVFLASLMCIVFCRYLQGIKVNLLSINGDKTHYIQFKTKNKPTPKIKFLGIYIHDTINWSCHIEYIIPKLSSACYMMRSIKSFMSLNTLKTVYCSYFNVIISYGLPFWGISPLAIKIFRTQKRIVRIMMGCKNGVSCRKLFRRLELLPFVSQYILLLMLFVVKNKSCLFLIQRITLKVQDNLIIFISP
jgi:hypothetical protein